MDKLSSYEWLGIPDAVAGAFALVSLSLVLAPWFGGLELGPLKVPKLPPHTRRKLVFSSPILFIAMLGGFFPVWSAEPSKSTDKLTEIELRWLEDNLSETTWNSDESWGTVSFGSSGRSATYTNQDGRPAGSMSVLDGSVGGSGFILFSGEWKQDDGKTGEFDLVFSLYGGKAELRWGPEKSISNKLTLDCWAQYEKDGNSEKWLNCQRLVE